MNEPERAETPAPDSVSLLDLAGSSRRPVFHHDGSSVRSLTNPDGCARGMATENLPLAPFYPASGIDGESLRWG
jgi:hypothetical protein